MTHIDPHNRMKVKDSNLKKAKMADGRHLNKDQLSLTNPRDALHHGEHTANK